MMLQRLPRLTLMALRESTKHYLFSLLRAAFRLTPDAGCDARPSASTIP